MCSINLFFFSIDVLIIMLIKNSKTIILYSNNRKTSVVINVISVRGQCFDMGTFLERTTNVNSKDLTFFLEYTRILLSDALKGIDKTVPLKEI